MALLQKSGQISFLRSNELGDRFGPPGDSIEAEVVVRLNSHPDEAYGLQLRKGNDEIAHTVMSDLLRDAFLNDIPVTLDVEIGIGNDVKDGDKNGMITRVALTK